MENNFFFNAINYYDKLVEYSKNYDIVLNTINIINDENINNDTEIKKEKEIVINKKNNMLCKYKKDTIGIYNTIDNIWTWYWIIQKSDIFKIVNWCNISITENNINNGIIRSILMTPKFIIVDDIQLDIILATASYLYKNNVILKKQYNHLIYYYAIKIEY